MTIIIITTQTNHILGEEGDNLLYKIAKIYRRTMLARFQ